MLSSVLYLTSLAAMYTVVILMKKSNSRHYNGVSWLILGFAIVMWINTFIAGIYGIVNIPFTLLSVSLSYILIIILGIIYIHRYGIQKYEWKPYDFLCAFVIFIIAIYVGIKLHTPRLLIAEASGDTCMHFRYALRVAETGLVKGEMFFAPVNNGLFIMLAKPFLQSYQYYKAFVAMGIMMLALSGEVFYAITNNALKNPKAKAFGLCTAVLYMLGYPLHNELMGFCYLGMSVSIIAVLSYILRLYLKDSIDENWAIFIMMLGCFSLVMCYMLFAPMIYIALLICLIIHYYKRKSFLSFVATSLKVFFIPCIFAVYYCYFNFFRNRALAISDAISTNGGTRGKLYSYLLILIPGTVYFIISEIKRKRSVEISVFLGTALLCALAVLAAVYVGIFSFYYYTKFLYPLWFVMSIASYYGIIYMWMHEKNTYYSYILVMLLLMFIWIGNVNQKIDGKAVEMGYGHLAENYKTISYGIYEENIFLIKDCIFPYNESKIKMYRYISDNLFDETVPVLGDLSNYLDVYWCENFTGQNLENYYYWKDDYSDSYERIINNHETNYVMVFYDTEMYNLHKDVWNKLDMVYETDIGCIYKTE